MHCFLEKIFWGIFIVTQHIKIKDYYLDIIILDFKLKLNFLLKINKRIIMKIGPRNKIVKW
jgi:hypothetical protein